VPLTDSPGQTGEVAGHRVGDALRSVRARILTSILLTTALGLAIAGGTTYVVQREKVLSELDTKLLSTVQALRFLAAGGEEGDDEVPTTVEEFLTLAMQRVLPDHNESTVGLMDGVPAFVPSSSVSFRVDHDAEFISMVRERADDASIVMGTAHSDSGRLRYVIIPVHIDGDDTVGHYVSAYSLDAEVEAIASSFTMYAVVAALTLILVGLVGWVVAGRLLRPIRTLRDAAATMTETDLSQRLEVIGRDDISELTATVNGMMSRLESSFITSRQLLDDVGHELKTPITIIRGHLELLRPDSDDDINATRELAIDELDRMSTLVADITLLAQSQTPGFVQPEPASVGDLTRAVFAKATALSTEHEWELESAAELSAAIDVQRITQAWLQLADNAVKYSPPGTTIHLGSAPSADGATPCVDLWVRDHGPGIPEDQLLRVFERFARDDEGRGIDGSGLGLSIVSVISQAHGGRAFARKDATDGAHLVIRIPRTLQRTK
jgi:two-component system OmpR family sensor kinase